MISKYNTKKILSILENKLGYIKPYLKHKNSFELLIAVILSARTNDNAVNKVTPKLFKLYPTPEKLSKANIYDIQKIIKKVNYYKNKANYIKEASKIIHEKFLNQIPSNIKDLTSLPGVGRKSANVILADVFKKKEGFVVDTHVKRVTRRIGWTSNIDPEKIEKDLMKQIPPKYWIKLPRQLIFIGRNYCKPKNPLCNECPISKYCSKRLEY